MSTQASNQKVNYLFNSIVQIVNRFFVLSLEYESFYPLNVEIRNRPCTFRTQVNGKQTIVKHCNKLILGTFRL